MALPTLNQTQYATLMGLLRAQMGKPYVWGAIGPGSFDCSGLVQWAYGKMGIALPRTTYQQINAGISVPLDELMPGDLVFFETDDNPNNGPDHVGIYSGNGNMMNAQNEDVGLKETSIASGYWRNALVGARRTFTVSDDGGTVPDDGEQPRVGLPSIGLPSLPVSGIGGILAPILGLPSLPGTPEAIGAMFEQAVVIGLGCAFVLIGMGVLLREPAVEIATTVATKAIP